MSAHDDRLIEIGQENVVEFGDNDRCECGHEYFRHTSAGYDALFCGVSDCECMEFMPAEPPEE